MWVKIPEDQQFVKYSIKHIQRHPHVDAHFERQKELLVRVYIPTWI